MSGLFIKNESGYYTNEDIYDDRGVLLLGKGHRVTAEVKNRLERLGIHIPGEAAIAREIQSFASSQSNSQSEAVNSVSQELKRKMNIRDDRILEKPNEILINIIFESKTKPWWIYVNALGNYIDWLYTHSIDVALISLVMAIEMGYSDEELTNLGIGTLLHDVGKLLVPKFIIQKPSSLTDAEMAVIKQHCELGISSLSNFNLPKEYTDIVLQHHERLDGSGYPKGLYGYEICRNAKIVMIADAVDAITAYRPYRQPESIDMAIKMLRDEGERFPQDYLSMLERILGQG